MIAAYILVVSHETGTDLRALGVEGEGKRTATKTLAVGLMGVVDDGLVVLI